MTGLITLLKNKQRLALITTLVFSISMSCCLIGVRMYFSESRTFLFLIWNLFLAGIPFGISTFLVVAEEKVQAKWVPMILLGFWLLFFPNAPYILTDLFHLRLRPPVPLWFDLLMLLSFAWNGLVLGLISLNDVQNFVQNRSNWIWGWGFALVSILLSGFGIYLGRYLRFNSWGVFTKPEVLGSQIWTRIQVLDLKMLGVTLLFSGFLLMIYLTFRQLSRIHS